MNLHENIHRIHQMMGVIAEDNRGELFKNVVDKHGVYYAIKLMGSFDYSVDEYLSNEDKIKFIKDVVINLCEKYNDVEVSALDLNGEQIIYDETDDESQVIEYYKPEDITIERYKTFSDDDYDDDDYDDDNYLGHFRKTYEELTPSLINEIFYLMLGQIK